MVLVTIIALILLVRNLLLFYLVFNSAVLSLRVLPDSDQVHILIACVNASNAAARTHVGIQVEHSEEGYTCTIMMVIW